MAQRLDYDPWGAVLRDTAPGFQPFGYGGGLYDGDTGLVRFGYRDYDPTTGRFLTRDPQGFGGGDFSLCTYAAGDPINQVDPDGGVAQLVAVVGGGALTGALQAGALSAAVQAVQRGCVDWGEVGKEALVGAVTGAVMGAAVLGLERLLGTARGAMAFCSIACFPADTAVAAEQGPVPLASLQPGDRVWARDEATGAVNLRPVAKVYEPGPKPIVALRVEDESTGAQETLRTTGDHPFWVEGSQWLPAADLPAGARLWALGDKRLRVLATWTTADVERVYNLEVEGDHSFFVGAAGAWVHNAGCGAAQALPRLPRSVGAAATITTTSRIGESSYAVRLAESPSQGAQRDIDVLLSQVRAGNMRV